MSKGTTKRSIRVEDQLWDEAKETAEARGDNLSELIREALANYIKGRRQSMTMPDEAIEAAAEALHRLSAMEPGEALARAVLEAAAPYLPPLSRRQGSRVVGNLIKAAEAKAWDEAYGKGFEAARGEPDTPNPHRSQA